MKFRTAQAAGVRLEANRGVELFQLEPPKLVDRLFNDKAVMQEYIPDPDDSDESIHLYSEFTVALLHFITEESQ